MVKLLYMVKCVADIAYNRLFMRPRNLCVLPQKGNSKLCGYTFFKIAL